MTRTITTGILMTDPDEWMANIPAEVNVCADRKGGWMIRHKLYPEWIAGIPMRGMADEVLKAFNEIESKARKEGQT